MHTYIHDRDSDLTLKNRNRLSLGVQTSNSSCLTSVQRSSELTCESRLYRADFWES